MNPITKKGMSKLVTQPSFRKVDETRAEWKTFAKPENKRRVPRSMFVSYEIQVLQQFCVRDEKSRGCRLSTLENPFEINGCRWWLVPHVIINFHNIILHLFAWAFSFCTSVEILIYSIFAWRSCNFNCIGLFVILIWDPDLMWKHCLEVDVDRRARKVTCYIFHWQIVNSPNFYYVTVMRVLNVR